MPARAAEVATMCGSGWIASSELTQTTAASPCAALMRCSCGWIVRVGSITEKNLRRSSSVQAASSVSAKVETRPWPALLTSIATAPSFSSTAAAKACTCSCDSTSQTDENNFAAGKRAQLRFHLLQTFLVAAAEGDRCAGFEQQLDSCQADARRAACHDGAFAFELNHAHCCYSRHMLTTLPDFSGAWSSRRASSPAVSRTLSTIWSSWSVSICGDGIVAPIAATTLPE